MRGCSAIVTGGAGGLGAATVERLVAMGMQVVAFDRAGTRADRLAASLAPDVVAVTGDVTVDDEVHLAIERARARGRLTVVVNAAGGGVGGGPTVRETGEPHDRSSFAATMEMNALGTFNVARLAAAAMQANEPDPDGQRGVIVNTASVAGFEGQRGQVAYAAAKAAIIGMTLPMARDLGPLGIRVCAIAPGPMATPALLAVLDRLDVDPTEGIVFPPRLGAPEEFARLVESIVGNPYLNGACIRLDAAVRPGAG